MSTPAALHPRLRAHPHRAAWLAAAGFCVAVAVVLLAQPSHGAVLDNGVVRMGLTERATLVAPGTLNADGTTSAVGLRLDSVNADGIAASDCACEGWGISHDGQSGYVKAGAATGLTLVSSSAAGASALSVVDAGTLRVTHSTHPVAATTAAFVMDVTVSNHGSAPATGITYRRVVDWSVDPAPGHEYVSLHANTPLPAWLLFSSDDGQAGANPLIGASQAYVTGPPAAPSVDDVGPLDHGALFDVLLGCLGPGDAVGFQVLYGAAPTEAGALAALQALGAQAWSLAQPQGDAATGTPQTFFLGFAGIDGPTCVLPAFTAQFTTTSPQDLTLDPVQFTDLTPVAPFLGYERRTVWSFGDTTSSEAATATHSYSHPGVYHACLTEMARAGGMPWRSWASCQDLQVADRPPVADFAWGPVGGAVAFADLSEDPDGTVTLLRWTFGDGHNATGAMPSHTYAAGGTYHVCLLAMDDLGLLASTCHDVDSPGASNHVPMLVPIHSRHIGVGGVVEFHLEAFDGDGDPLTFTAANLPAGSLFVPQDAYFSWSPSRSQVGYHDDITFRVSDGRGGQAERTLVVLVSDTSPDGDHDGVPDDGDNCPAAANADQSDADADGFGDACDSHTDAAPDAHDIYVGNDGSSSTSTSASDTCGTDRGAIDRDKDGITDSCDDDLDGDGVPNRAGEGAYLDNCPLVPNADQADSDNDGFGDACAPPVLYDRTPVEAAAAPTKVTGRPLPKLDADQYPPDPQRVGGGMQPWLILTLFSAAGIVLGLGIGLFVRNRLRR